MSNFSIQNVGPAWSYANQGWPHTTGLVWDHAGTDGLRMWLPPNLMSIKVRSLEGREHLAWLEARLGNLPDTYVSGPVDDAGVVGAYVFQCPMQERYRPDVTMDVVTASTFAVWPTLGTSRMRWFDQRTGLDTGVPEHSFPWLPEAWREELHSSLDLTIPQADRSVPDVLERFVRETFVQAGPHDLALYTEDIFEAYTHWVDINEIPESLRAKKVTLGQWLSSSDGLRRWAGRTPLGFRRGFVGLRFPDGKWLT